MANNDILRSAREFGRFGAAAVAPLRHPAPARKRPIPPHRLFHRQADFHAGDRQMSVFKTANMEPRRVVAIAITCLAVLSTGCHSITWEDWQFLRIEQVSHEHPVNFASSPPGAEIALDGRTLGRTPVTANLPYTETAAVFERKQIERDGLEKRVLRVETDRRNVTGNPTSRTARFTRPHYHESLETVTVPKQNSVHSTLKQVAYDWEYQTTDEKVPRSQTILIESEPAGATLFVGDQVVGNTPLRYSFPYSISELLFQKTVVHEQQGPAPRTSTEQKRTHGGATAVPYELTLKHPRYHDSRVTLTVPAPQDRLFVELVEVAGIYDIACTVKITAREQYFPPIEDVIRSHAVPDASGTPLMDQVSSQSAHSGALRSLGIGEKTYELLVKDLEQFGRLVSRLQQLAQKNDFVFHITNALLSADFDTNVMQGEMEHTITGLSRPGSQLYLVPGAGKAGELEGIPVDDETARYEKKVRLQPGENDVFLLSIYVPPNNRYAPPLAVFLRVNVHSQKQTELNREEFEKSTGRDFSDERVRSLAARPAP